MHFKTNQLNQINQSNLQTTQSNLTLKKSTPTHNPQQRLTRNSGQSSDFTLQNTLRLHRTLSKKGTITIQTVPESGTQNRNSMTVVSPMKNLLKTPTMTRKQSGQQIIQSRNIINLQTNPSLQEIPDSVRQCDIKFLGEVKQQSQSNKSKSQNSYIIYRVLIRIIISQALIGCLFQLNIHFSISGLIDLIILQIFRFFQSNRKWIQIIELILSLALNISILLLFEIDFIWTITFLVLIAIDTILEFVILKMQRKPNFDTLPTQV
ncbi:unnamed protein product (macronuclear) [Paramecium tetraurelia]|uniref:Transmembrane protein n=1 Tax=Paramecium tetraurelia TaxID=5888 RepID=A0CA45_PARTE|nr:uncharacterized protein GSPATT00036441001 [Paramecium tetraurelia]CAK67662.1 unnamed protein product [Paramecium tetraurelia]|eukprot:XP_001435059.1 hypothetical protein (macronuclear) [Paramecium tetraurelia strain d4-2]